MKKWLLLLIITTSTYAQNIVVEKYCFNSTAESIKAQDLAKNLLLGSDKIAAEDECFSLFVDPNRRELIQKYIRNSYPQMSVGFSSVESTSQDMCGINVEKIKTVSNTQTKARIEALSGASIGTNSSTSTENSQIRVMSNAPFELFVDEERIQGKCKFVSPSRYEIEFAMIFVPRPVIPTVPENTAVIIATPVQPPPTQGTSLTTVIQLNRGEKLEIGSIVKDLTNQASKADLLPSLSLGKNRETSQERIYLNIE